MLRFSHGGCEQWGRFLNGFDANMQKRAKIHHTEMKKGYFFSHKLGTKKIIPLRMRTPVLVLCKGLYSFWSEINFDMTDFDIHFMADTVTWDSYSKVQWI